jgi:hypothetical protein
MKEPSKPEVMGYVAEMAEQLAALCRERDEPVSAILSAVAALVRDRLQKRKARTR